jgi:hypothetical protein
MDINNYLAIPGPDIFYANIEFVLGTRPQHPKKHNTILSVIDLMHLHMQA